MNITYEEKFKDTAGKYVNLLLEQSNLKAELTKYRVALRTIADVKGSPPYNVARKIAEKALE